MLAAPEPLKLMLRILTISDAAALIVKPFVPVATTTKAVAPGTVATVIALLMLVRGPYPAVSSAISSPPAVTVGKAPAKVLHGAV